MSMTVAGHVHNLVTEFEGYVASYENCIFYEQGNLGSHVLKEATARVSCKKNERHQFIRNIIKKTNQLNKRMSQVYSDSKKEIELNGRRILQAKITAIATRIDNIGNILHQKDADIGGIVNKSDYFTDCEYKLNKQIDEIYASKVRRSDKPETIAIASEQLEKSSALQHYMTPVPRAAQYGAIKYHSYMEIDDGEVTDHNMPYVMPTHYPPVSKDPRDQRYVVAPSSGGYLEPVACCQQQRRYIAVLPDLSESRASGRSEAGAGYLDMRGGGHSPFLPGSGSSAGYCEMHYRANNGPYYQNAVSPGRSSLSQEEPPPDY